ncbi:TPA: hypothetical protein ACYYHP_002537, partial [Salmonella enterica subsp. enterica serovar Yopougon]
SHPEFLMTASNLSLDHRAGLYKLMIYHGVKVLVDIRSRCQSGNRISAPSFPRMGGVSILNSSE